MCDVGFCDHCNSVSPMLCLLCFMGSLLIMHNSTVGIPVMLFTLYAIPASDGAESIYSKTKSLVFSSVSRNTESLSEKLNKLLPAATLDSVPDYSLQFWTPISINFGSSGSPTVTMCKLNFQKYSLTPHEFPMFKDLVAISNCNGGNSIQRSISDIKREIEQGQSKSIPPTGFVFHEGRVGSTLIANLLGSNPYSLVFSESDPPLEVLTGCRSCSRDRKIEVFRDLMAIMGVSPVHKYMFFKFQSITTTVMELALEVAIRIIILIYLHYP